MQRLVGEKFARPSQVVGWLLAQQSQEYGPSKWGLGLRLDGHDDASVEAAYTRGEILRTHALRPTWHSVAAEDIRWLLRLTSPRVEAQNAYRYRQLELDSRTLDRGTEILADALAGGRHLTRPELAERLRDAGIATDGQRLAYLVMHAELSGVICSGPRRGKQHTYALLDERAPGPDGPSGDEALAELARRFFTSHGPASAYDLAWWSSLTVTSAKKAAALVADELESFEFEGRIYRHGEIPDAAGDPEAVLLPDYDESFVGYRPPRVRVRGGVEGAAFDRPVTIEAETVASWKRKVERKRVLVWLTSFTKLDKRESRVINVALERYEAFIGLPVVVAEIR